MDYLPILLAAAASIYLWGVLRTAIWTLPCLFAPDLLALVSVALLSFWAVAAIFIPYRQGAFDWRSLTREKHILSFFLSGVLTGSFFYPTGLLFFGLGALIPLICLLLFEMLRFPVGRIFFLPRSLKLILPLLWILSFVGIRGMELIQ